MKSKRGVSPSDVVTFLINLLKQNDNSINPYDNGHYIACIINTIANLTFAERDKQLELLLTIDVDELGKVRPFNVFHPFLPSPADFVQMCPNLSILMKL